MTLGHPVYTSDATYEKNKKQQSVLRIPVYQKCINREPNLYTLRMSKEGCTHETRLTKKKGKKHIFSLPGIVRGSFRFSTTRLSGSFKGVRLTWSHNNHQTKNKYGNASIWGGFGQQDRLNYRSLLQKSPIEEAIFCKRDCNFIDATDCSHPIS